MIINKLDNEIIKKTELINRGRIDQYILIIFKSGRKIEIYASLDTLHIAETTNNNLIEIT